MCNAYAHNRIKLRHMLRVAELITFYILQFVLYKAMLVLLHISNFMCCFVNLNIAESLYL